MQQSELGSISNVQHLLFGVQRKRDRSAESPESESQRTQAFEATASWWRLWRREQRDSNEVVDEAFSLAGESETLAHRWPHDAHVARIDLRMSARASA